MTHGLVANLLIVGVGAVSDEGVGLPNHAGIVRGTLDMCIAHTGMVVASAGGDVQAELVTPCKASRKMADGQDRRPSV